MLRLHRRAARLAWIGSVSAASIDAAEALSYNDHIQPILAENCFHCHGPDPSTRKAKLRLDRANEATMARDGRDPAITPGQPDASELIARIVSKHDDERMPPPEAHKTLKPAEIALLRRWIVEGARYEPHWAFVAPVRPAEPEVPGARGWAKNPLDRFVAARLAKEGLAPAREEDPTRLLRRAAFDLTGLPPTPRELADFAADRSPEAFERAVDRMLATDASAEHFTRQWLDAVRYGDTNGIHLDNFRSIWPYRDWVLGAFRANMPFDRFTIEQVAGDMLPAATFEQKIASGFNRCLPTTGEGGAIPEEYEAIGAKDRVETFSAVWLGLTTGCAACHDHKFDPITQRDFYSLAAFFRNSTVPAMDGNRADTPPSMFVPAASDREAWERLRAEIARLDGELQARGAAAEGEFASWLTTAKTLTPPPADRAQRLHASLVAPEPAMPSALPSGGPYGPATALEDGGRELGPPVPWLREKAESFSLLLRLSGSPRGTLLSCLEPEARSAGWELFLENGKLGVRVTNEHGEELTRQVASRSLTSEAWHHVVLVVDAAAPRGRAIDLFVDGRGVGLDEDDAAALPDIRPAGRLRLGGRAAPAGGTVWVQDVRHIARSIALAEAKELAAVLDTFAALQRAPDQRQETHAKLLRAHFLSAVDAPSLAIAARRLPLRAREDELRARGGTTLVMEEKPDSVPFAHVLNRGEYTQKGEKVPAAAPSALPPLPAATPADRLALARWLFDPQHPLTARVTANRAWQYLFGTGIVESTGDFGVMGSRPSHRELLDWLAVEFRESGWDYRRLIRTMVTSATYRQSAAIPPELRERDPDNRLLARGPRHRLDGEQLRDQALAASGLLVSKVGGRSVRPYQPAGVWEDVAMKNSTSRFYRQETGENLYRRSLYTVWKRIAPPPALELFNAPSRDVACVRRDRTNTPLQALVTLNEPLYLESARQLATQALRASPRFDARVDHLSLRLLGRSFEAAERAVVRGTLERAAAVYERDRAAAERLLAIGASPVDRALPAPELAAWTLLASQILNLDETLTK